MQTQQAENARDCQIIQDATTTIAEHNAATFRLLERNAGFINSFINRYNKFCNALCDEDDLRQELSIGMIRAAQTYDAEKGAFTTYAWQWLRQTAQRFTLEQQNICHVPTHTQELISQLMQKYNAPWLSAEFYNQMIEDEELSDIALRALKSLYGIATPIYLDKEVGSVDSDDADTIGSFIPSDDDVEKTAIGNVDNEMFWERVKETLTEQEFWVIQHRFGYKCQARTLEWCGNNYPYSKNESGVVTRERIRQVEGGAIRKLRKIHARLNHYHRDELSV